MRTYAFPRDRPDHITPRTLRGGRIACLLILLWAACPLLPAFAQRSVWSGSPPFGGGYTGLYELKPAGDIDADGIADVITTTGFANLAPPRVVLFRGLDGSVAWWQSTGGAWFGVDSIGDVNGDLIDDVAVGRTTPVPGRVDVRSGLDGSLVYQVLGTGGGFFGTGVAALPDFDGDGVLEFAVSDWASPTNPLLVFGVLRAFSGNVATAGNSLWSASFAPLYPSPSGNFPTVGWLKRVGDIDGDGFPDLVTWGQDQAFRFVSGPTGQLIYTIIYPASFVPYTAIFPTQPYGWVAGIGDVDGDGIDDLALSGADGAGTFPSGNCSGSLPGVVQVRSGQNGASIWWLTSSVTTDGFGMSVEGGEDWSGDGIPDVLVGTACLGQGVVEVRSGLDGAFVTSFGPPPGSAAVGFGRRIAAIPDSNGDGVAEIAVSAPLTPVGGVANSGVIYLYTLCDIFGSGCPGSGGITPRLRCAGGSAAVGNGSFALQLRDAPPGADAFLLLGVSDATWAGVTLPWAIPGSAGCSVLVSGDVIAGPVPTGGTGPGTGAASMALPVPPDPAAVGSVAYAQWAVSDPAQASVAVSRGVRLEVLP